jgi:hypothetical protein
LPLVGGFFPPPDNQPDVIKDELGKKVCHVVVPSTGRLSDLEMGRLGDWETRRQGDGESVSLQV